jgi:hypothetical protein
VRAVLEVAIQKMTENDRYWRPGLEEEFFSLVPRWETSPHRCTQFKAFGSLIMMAIFHRVPPDPVSPFLLAHIFQGDAILEDRDFIGRVAPATLISLADWPADDSAVPALPKNCSLLANLEMQVRITIPV